MTDDDARERARLRALEALRDWSGEDFVWDGVDEDDRPLTPEEFDAGLELAKSMNLPGKIKVVSSPDGTKGQK